MDYNRREFFISRIDSGYLLFSKGDIELKICSPSKELKYKAEIKFQDDLKLAEQHGLMSDDDLIELLVDLDIWNEDKEKAKIELEKNLEKLKIELFQAVFKSNLQATIRKYIKTTKQELEILNIQRHELDYITCHGYATYSKHLFILENSTFFGENKYDWLGIDLMEVLDFFNKQTISDEQMRELARTEPWLLLWSIKKKSNKIFDEPFSDDQKRLFMWSRLYDSVYESMDCPPDEVIDDDDMLDGWLILQRRERERDNAKKAVDSKLKNDKIASADEVYILADTPEDTEKIEMLNDQYGKIVKASRLKKLKDKGELKHTDFSDIKQKFREQVAQTQIQAIKQRGRL